jgi:hypothetical protein
MSLAGLVYRTGTVTVTNGSATIEGTDTVWSMFVGVGGQFQIAGFPPIPIEVVVDDTEATLMVNWPHATQEDVEYWITLTGSTQALLTRLNELQAQQLARGVLVKLKPDARGSLGGRSAHDAKPEGFIYGVNDNPPFYVYYEKATDAVGNWAGPFQWYGPAGDDGDDGTSADLGAILGAATPVEGVDAGVLAIDLNLGENLNHEFTITANRTLGFPTTIPNNGITFYVMIIQDGSGGHTLDFATGYEGPGGALPIVSALPNAETLLAIYVKAADRAFVFTLGQDFA